MDHIASGPVVYVESYPFACYGWCDEGLRSKRRLYGGNSTFINLYDETWLWYFTVPLEIIPTSFSYVQNW